MHDFSDETVRVTTLELFFDLVFVFTITQLTTVLVRQPTWRGLLQTLLMLGVIWWMYSGYAWLTNAVSPDRSGRRLLLLAGMASYLVLALAVPRAFSGSGLAFGLAYLAVVLVHAALFSRTASSRVIRAVFEIAPFNLFSATLVLVAGIVGGTAEYILWAAAFALEWVTPQLIDNSGFEVRPAHFVERHGLVVLIAIGESTVAIGIGAAGLAVNASLALFAVLGLALSACLWRIYFGGDERRAERALVQAPPARRPALALNSYGYWHLPILLGVIAIAAAEKRATGHGFAHLHGALALALGGGVAVFLAGDVLFRRSLGLGPLRPRLITAALALATVPLGIYVAATLQVGALVALAVACILAEQAWLPAAEAVPA